MAVTGTLRWVLVAATLAGCGGGDNLLLPGAGEPASVSVLQGNEQNGRVGEALPQPLVVAVEDGAGRPVEGATVVFVLTDPAPGAALDPDTATTDADGTATSTVVLGSRPGAQNGEVRALGGNGTPTASAPFALTALSEDANGIRLVSGDGQMAPVGAALPNPLVVEVTDAFGNPIEGVPVAWSPDGGGSVSATTTNTGADGLTSVSRTLGATAGTQRTFATVDGLAGSPVTFVHTATAGSASGVSIVSGNNQRGPVSTELPLPLVVEVRDAQNNAVPNVPVTWVIGTGGGSVTPTTSNTDPSGRATAAWTLGPDPVTNTVSAVAAGGVAQFTAEATAGAPARLVVKTQPASSAVSGVVLSQQPVVQLLDAQGNEAKQADVEVQVAIGSGGGTLGGTSSRLTDGNGQATFTDLVLSGSPGTRTLRFSATGFASVTSSQINLGAASTVTTITSDTPEPSQTGQGVTVQFTVTSAVGMPTGSVLVHDGGDTCSGDLSGGKGSCTITLSSAGNRTLTADYAGADGFAPSSDTEGHTVEAPPTPVLALAQQPASSATVGAALSPQPIVQLQDGAGGSLPTAGVNVSVAIVSGGGSLSGTTTVQTNGQGQAVFTDLAITGDPGMRTLVFTATGYTSATSNQIDVQPPPPSGLTSTVQAAATAIAVGASTTITVTVRDATGTALSGRSVTLQSSGTGDTVDPASVLSAGDGTAVFTFSSTTPETKTISATADGVAIGSTTVTVEAAPPPPPSG
jgi:hypothetical protein